jgi:signal transduction histidine kinase
MLNRDLRTLSARLIATQDEERRRIARDLHDSVGQLIAALSMNHGLVFREAKKLSPQAADALQQNTLLVEQLSKEIRTISHLLHPPLLDEIGLLPAIKMFAEGFGERSSVKVTVDLSPDIGRLAPNMEISVFRIVQECLTNVYRHSGSKTARIKIWPSQETLLTVQVCDEGKGMSYSNRTSAFAETNHGVGLSGMRERVRELGGTLEIQSTETGTTITAAFPVTHTMAIGV